MKILPLTTDLRLFCVTASSFPMGVGGAFQKLESLLPSKKGRQFFGVSRPDKSGTIIYRAAVQEAFEGEGEKSGCETMVLKKGNYLAVTISDWKKNERIIGETFQELIHDPRMDPDTYCYEMYSGENDVTCMVRIRD